MSLFDKWLKDAKEAKLAKDIADRAARPKGQKCSTCKHMIRHEYSDRYNYCYLRDSTKTTILKATTKRSNWCNKWEAKQ